MTIGVFETVEVTPNSMAGVGIGQFDSISVDCDSIAGITIGQLEEIPVEISEFKNIGYFGIFDVVEKVCVGSGVAVLKYFMRAWDADGAQYVYWESANPPDIPTATEPVAVGVLTNYLVLAKTRSS